MQPFKNIRVIDLTHVIAGPFCSYQLSVMGADVIKVEPPDNPDVTRAVGNKFPAGEEGLGYLFTAQNANKRSVAVDIKSPEGREILLVLCRDADVFIENYRSGAMADCGLDYDSVRAVNPGIIYCSMTAFGQGGPLGERTAYDNVIQAFSGLMGVTGDQDSAPLKVGAPVLDYGTGIQAAYAIACALFQRVTTGEGQYIDVSMLDSALMLMSDKITLWHQKGRRPSLTGNASDIYAGYSCYETRQGKIMLGAYNRNQVRRLWALLGDADHGETVAENQPRQMTGHLATDTSRIAELMMARTAEEWEVIFNQARIPAARVRTVDEALAEQQVQQRQGVQSIRDGEHVLPVAGFSYQSNGPSLDSPPPVFAQHTRSVLHELGYNDAQINELAANGTIAVDDSA
jgi:crotonobetainyl-CoA:carnitine CoA-transferase CaiB-like acyl-CoA transferase